MPYQARGQSLFQTGGPNSVSNPIDYGGLLDAATHGATSLIQNAYARKVQDRTFKMQQDREDLANSRAQDQFSFEREKLAQENDFRTKQLEHQTEQARLGALGRGVVAGDTKLSLTPQPEAPPPIAQSFGQALNAPGALNAGNPNPAPAIAAPSIGSIPRLNVQTTEPHYDQTQDPIYGRLMGGITARGDVQSNLVDQKEDYRATREDLNRQSRETIANNRNSTQLQIHDLTHNPDGTIKPVTGTARLQHISNMARTYMKKPYLGGLGLSQADALSQATQDIDGIIGGQPRASRTRIGATPVVAPSDPGGNVNLGAPGAPAAPGSAIHDGPAQPAADPIASAVAHIKAKTGSLAQLEASNNSPAFKAAVKARLAKP